MTMTGQCLCGQVKYETACEPLMTVICHCKNCQHQSGSAFSIIVAVPSSKLTVSGELKTFNDKGESGNIVHRRFCEACGSPLFSVLTDTPTMTIIKAGTLDDTSILNPQAHIWCKSAQPWVSIDPALPQFPENAPARK